MSGGRLRRIPAAALENATRCGRWCLRTATSKQPRSFLRTYEQPKPERRQNKDAANPNAIRICTNRCPKGTNENSPAIYRWVANRADASPEGTAEEVCRRMRSVVQPPWERRHLAGDFPCAVAAGEDAGAPRFRVPKRNSGIAEAFPKPSRCN